MLRQGGIEKDDRGDMERLQALLQQSGIGPTHTA